MRSRVVVPETLRIALSGDDWIRIKRDLNAGEMIELFERSTSKDDPTKPDRARTALALVLAYLVDWSLVDPQGDPIVVIDQPADVKQAALYSIDFESYSEIVKAVETHDQARRQEKKRRPAAEKTSSEISESPLV